MYTLKHSLGTTLSTTLSSVYSYFTNMIGLTKRSHVAPKMQYVTFCDSIVRFDWCRTKRIDSMCGVTGIPLCARGGSVISWGRGEGETLSIHVVSTQCTSGLTGPLFHYIQTHKNGSISSNFTLLFHVMLLLCFLFMTRTIFAQDIIFLLSVINSYRFCITNSIISRFLDVHTFKII